MFDAVWTLGITSSCLMTKQCLIVFDRQTFPVWTGLKNHLSLNHQQPYTKVLLNNIR